MQPQDFGMFQSNDLQSAVTTSSAPTLQQTSYSGCHSHARLSPECYILSCTWQRTDVTGSHIRA